MRKIWMTCGIVDCRRGCRGERWIRFARGVAWAGILGVLAGCAGEPSGPEGAQLIVDRSVVIRANTAHTSFQAGRQVGGTTKLDAYCELEVRKVSETPQRVEPGRYAIAGQRFTLLKDPTTRIPALAAGFDCSTDTLYQESWWRLASASGGNLYSLRCIRPLFQCRMLPPLGLDAIDRISGGALGVKYESYGRAAGQRPAVHSP